MFSFVEIGHIFLVAICFLFKSDIAIGYDPISVFEIEGDPFYAIPDKKWNI